MATPDFVLTTHGAPGDLLPYLAIGQRLAARGHAVRVATSGCYAALVKEHELDFWPLEPDLPPTTAWEALMHPATGTEWLLRHHLCPVLPQTVAQLHEAVQGASVLVTHTTSLAGPVVAEMNRANGLRWASGVVSPLAFFSRLDPPALPVAPWAARYPRFSRVLLSLLERQFGAFLKPVGALRRQLGLPPGTNPLFRDAHSPLLALGLFSTALVEAQRDWPTQLQVTGFCHGLSERRLSGATAEFLSGGERVVVLAGASFLPPKEAEAVHELALQLAARGIRCLVLGVNGPGTANRAQAPSPKVHMSAFEPLDQVLPLLPEASLYLHQGGIGATAAGLRAGVPMALFPRSHDQPDTARMASRRNLAVNLGPKVPTVSRVLAVMDDLATNPAAAYARDNAKRQVEQEDGAAAAANALEALGGARV